MFLKYKTFALVLFSLFFAHAQEFSGSIKDAKTKEAIPYSKISLIDFEISTVANENGLFSFKLKLPTTVKLKISSPNYQTIIAVFQTNVPAEIYLEDSHLELDEVVISTGKSERLKNSITPIELKKINELKLIPTTNLGEALSNVAGVYNSSTGNGISKPVIRGLQGNQVVTYLNGIRIENQQWGGDHGMGITDLGLDQVEIIKGPASLQFGGDALGGVIYFSDDTYAKQNSEEWTFQSQMESNSLGINNKIEYKKAKKNLRFNLSGLYSNHADYRLANGKFAGNSRFSESSFKAAISYNKQNMVNHFRYNFSNNRVGIPGHTHDTVINFETFQYLTQKRSFATPVQLINNHFISNETKYFLKKGEVNLILGYTNNSLTELEEKITIPAIKINLANALYHLKFKYNLSDKSNILVGFQGMYQQTKNDRLATEFLIPNGNVLDNGVYAIFNQGIARWNLQVGARYDTRNLRSTEAFKENPTINKQFDNLNYAIGAVYNTKATSFRINFSNAYRAPHFSELLSNGVHHGSLRYEVGNQQLKAEKANQLDVLLDIHNEHLALTINPFYTFFQNFIYVEPKDSIVEGYDFFEYQQKQKVDIYGIDVGLHYHPHFAHFLHLESSFSRIQFDTPGKNTIALIPQNRINSFIKLNFSKKGVFTLNQIVLQHTYHFAQNQVATFETPSKAYHLFNSALNFKLAKKQEYYIDLGFKNFLNESYINHLSRLKNIQLPNPGWNVYLSVKYHFTKQQSNN